MKSAATLIVSQEVACVIKCNNDLRNKTKNEGFAFRYMVSYGIILRHSNIGGIAGSAFADH